jgi:hypothetical protein
MPIAALPRHRQRVGDLGAADTGLAEDFTHKVVDHAESYLKDGVHTNGLENFWSLLKRTIKGTYVSFPPFSVSQRASFPLQ